MTPNNRIRRKLDSQEPIFGAKVATHDPSVIDILGQVGLDFAWIDIENKGRSALDGRFLGDLVRASDSVDVELIVRLPETNETMLQTVLSAGVNNVLIPQVRSADQVREVVRSTRFTFDGSAGTRSASFCQSSNWGNAGDSYVDTEDSNKCIGIMIENQAAVDDIDEILDVPGVDFIRIGSSDLSISLGAPLQTDAPEVAESVERVKEAIASSDVVLSRDLKKPEQRNSTTYEDENVFTVGRDLNIVRDVLTERKQELV